jgi:hypothetical protein
MATFTYETNGYILTLEVNETGTSVANNSSTVSWAVKLYAKSGWGFSQHSFGYVVKLNGVTVAELVRVAYQNQLTLNSGGTITIISGTSEVTHNADGTLNGMVAYAELDCASLTYLPDGTSVTGTMNLTPVARSVVYIDNESTFEAYQVYVDNGTSWELYIPYIDDGSNWVQYG